MAEERTKDITKINITISPVGKSRRTLTALHDWDSGEGPEKVVARDADLYGNTYLIKKEIKMGTSTIAVKVGSQDERFLDDLVNNTIAFDFNVIDESSALHKKQFTGKECYISKRPADPFREGDSRTYEILASEFTPKSL